MVHKGTEDKYSVISISCKRSGILQGNTDKHKIGREKWGILVVRRKTVVPNQNRVDFKYVYLIA